MSGRYDPDGTLRKGSQQDATASKSTSQALRGVLHATSSKKTASGMVNALISSFNGQPQHTAGNSTFMAAPGSSSSSSANAKANTPVPVNLAQMTNNLVLHPRCGSAKQLVDGSSAVPMASSIASAADAARLWNSHAGATSTSAPVSPTMRSFTEPGELKDCEEANCLQEPNVQCQQQQLCTMPANVGQTHAPHVDRVVPLQLVSDYAVHGELVTLLQLVHKFVQMPSMQIYIKQLIMLDRLQTRMQQLI